MHSESLMPIHIDYKNIQGDVIFAELATKFLDLLIAVGPVA